MIRWFKDIREEDYALVGGKGAHLAKMFNHHVTVPDGFVVLASAYDTYVAGNGLQEIIDGLLVSELTLVSQSEAIKKLFIADKITENLRDSIIDEFKKFGSGRVAVRSSSTVEDLPGMSFAGQYTTYLNVTEANLIEKVVACWQSLWNVRAMDYRNKNGVTSDFSHAVVIQEMVAASVSGVAFTANPMNGLRHQLVVNASWGLGEAVVSGEVNPDQYIVDRMTGEIVAKVINDKQIKYVYNDKGIEKVEVFGIDAEKACLNDFQISKLIEAAEKVEAYFGKPQDMEFAFDNKGELFIVQSRDITTLYPIDSLTQDGKLRAYMSAGTVLLGLKEPFTPLGYDLMSNMFPTIINVMTARKKKPLTNNFVCYAGHRIFVDMTYLLSSGFVAKQFANAISGNDLPLKGVMNQMLLDYGKQFRRQGIHFRPPLGFIKYGLSMAMTMRHIMKIPNDQRYDAMIEEGNRWYAEIEKDYAEAATVEQRLDFALKALVQAFRLSQAQAAYCLAANNYIKIDKVLKKHFGGRYKVETLAQSLPGCFTQTMTVRLNEYAKYCDENGLEPTADNPEFGKILDVYGHRANIELDFGTRRWREDPSYLLDLVKTYKTDKMYERNLADHEIKAQEALDMIEEVTEELKKKIGNRRAEKFRNYMINYRYGAAMREYPKSDIVRFLELARKSVLTIGDKLVAEGELDDREDIFFLRKEVIIKGNNFKALVNKAKVAYDKEMKRTTIPRMLLNNGHTYYTASEIDPNAEVIEGMPLSAGVYEGSIRVVFDPLNTSLKEGEIMVTESTNPAWTPLFAIAGALIMEYGGPMSHGGIVAREYGIPAVVGIPSATATLKDGQRVRVNGETGIIEIL